MNEKLLTENSDSIGKVFLKKILRHIWIPIIPILVGLIFWLIGFYHINTKSPTTEDAFGNFSLISRTIGETMLFRISPLIFAIAIMLAFAKGEKGAAVLLVTAAYVVFIGVMAGMMLLWQVTPNKGSATMMGKNGWSPNFDAADHVSQTMGFVLGKYVPEIGWLGALLVGVVSIYVFNATYTYKAPKIIGFFSGTRFSPVVIVIVSALLGLCVFFIWYILQVNYFVNYKVVA